MPRAELFSPILPGAASYQRLASQPITQGRSQVFGPHSPPSAPPVELKAFTRPSQSAASPRLPHPNLTPLGQCVRPIPLPAQPTRALKPAGEWARGGPSTLTAWPIGGCAWPRRPPIGVERGGAAERSGPNIPPPPSRPLSPSQRAAVHLPPPFLLSPSATRTPAALGAAPGVPPPPLEEQLPPPPATDWEGGRRKGGRKGSRSNYQEGAGEWAGGDPRPPPHPPFPPDPQPPSPGRAAAREAGRRLSRSPCRHLRHGADHHP